MGMLMKTVEVLKELREMEKKFQYLYPDIWFFLRRM